MTTFLKYLQIKYGVNTPTTMTYKDASMVGLKWPLKSGWLKTIASFELSDAQLDAMMIHVERKRARGGIVAYEQSERLRSVFGTPLDVKESTRLAKSNKRVADDDNKKCKKKSAKNKDKNSSFLKASFKFAVSDEFLSSYEWRKLRMEVLIKHGRRCMCCGATPDHGAVMNVDHIKPRRLFPELALDINNLQVLCGECNHGKGNWNMTDWRNC